MELDLKVKYSEGFMIKKFKRYSYLFLFVMCFSLVGGDVSLYAGSNRPEVQKEQTDLLSEIQMLQQKVNAKQQRLLAYESQLSADPSRTNLRNQIAEASGELRGLKKELVEKKALLAKDQDDLRTVRENNAVSRRPPSQPHRNLQLPTQEY